MKNSRQQKILELIDAYDIDTQEMMIDKLREAGINATQTTISRDIRDLKLVKGLGANGTYKYILPGVNKEPPVPVLNSALTDSVIRIEAAGNIVVIRTFPGMANALAVCVDALEHQYIVGSVAGDDTILLVVRSEQIAYEVEKKLKEVFSVK